VNRLGFGKAETEGIRNIVNNQEEFSSGNWSENVALLWDVLGMRLFF